MATVAVGLKDRANLPIVADLGQRGRRTRWFHFFGDTDRLTDNLIGDLTGDLDSHRQNGNSEHPCRRPGTNAREGDSHGGVPW